MTEAQMLLTATEDEAKEMNITSDPSELKPLKVKKAPIKAQSAAEVASFRTLSRPQSADKMEVPGSARSIDKVSVVAEEAAAEEKEEINKNFTGLIKESGETEDPIVEAIWMNMEFLVVLTQDEDNHINLELFTCNPPNDGDAPQGITQFCDKLELCNRGIDTNLQIKVDPTRKLLAVIISNSQPTIHAEGDEEGPLSHEIEGYLVDFRKFSVVQDNPEDIIIVTLNTQEIVDYLGQKQIKQLQILFNNLEKSTYDMEMLILIGSVGQGDQEASYTLFGGSTIFYIEQEVMEMYAKPLKTPIENRKVGLIGFIRFSASICLLIFEDGYCCTLKNEKNEGVLNNQLLGMGMDRANSAIFDEQNTILCLQSIHRVRSFLRLQKNGQWEHFSDHNLSKYSFLSIMDKFVIARNADKFTYLLELNGNLETVSQIRIGDDDTWNFAFDASTKYQQYCILYQRLGKNFQWHKYDYQNQFHLSQAKTLEQVCNGTIFRLTKENAEIEIKLELKNFEDRFYEYQSIKFDGLPITVSTFTPYAIPGDKKKFLLTIKPQQTLLKRKIKRQYFVIIDCEANQANECVVENVEQLVLNKIFFYSDYCFMGQKNVSPTNYEFCEYEIEEIGEGEGWKLHCRNENFCITSKGITSFGYDSKRKNILFIRDQILDDADECEVFALSLKKYLNQNLQPRQKIHGFTVEQVSTVFAKLMLFTEPISVITLDDEIAISATFNGDSNTVFACVSNTAMSLLFRVDMTISPKLNMGLKFEQIITIKSAKQILQVNKTQLVVQSPTQLCVVTIDPNEQDDIKYLFEPGNEEVQCKVLVGKNIDLKMDFDSNIFGMTADQSVITVIYGSASVLLELADSQYDRWFNSNGESEQKSHYKNHIGNLNDLVFVFKHILSLFYGNFGYIKITEDQGDWDKSDTYCPVTMYVADFVTLIQDEDGNQGSDESPIIRHLYQNNYNIWESILRDAMATGRLEISYQQINRFLSPVITDHGQNLMFHFCFQNPDKLDEIMNLPGYEEYYKPEKKMFPIYYNFQGHTQITIALNAHDNQSFYKLMMTLINMQNCFESSFLVNTWMISAFEQSLDIFPLLESQILQTVCDATILEHFTSWPQFHRVVDKLTENYDKSFMSLMHDEEGYAQLFGHQFYDIEKEDEHLLKQKLFEISKDDDSRDNLFPIRYFAERLPSTAMNPEGQLEVVFTLFEILSETGQMSYFRSGFIKRLIEYHWNGPLVRYYAIVSGMYFLSWFLIMTSTVLLAYHRSHPLLTTQIRIGLMGTNLIVLCMSLCTFEIKSFLADKSGYIKSFWNQNDICLFCSSTAVLVLEIRHFVLHRSEYDYLYVEEEEKEVIADGLNATDISAALLRRMLKPKRPGGMGDLGSFDPYGYYEYPIWESYLRVVYSILVVNTFLKMLNVAQFSEQVAFIVKMLETIFEVFSPFLMFNFSIMIMFSFCANALDIIYYNTDSPYQGGDYEGFFGMAGPILLWTVRNGVGDFVPDTFKYLPQSQRVTMWIYWLMIVAINVMVFMNFTIAVINDCYGEIIETREEEAYQKKCGILCELEGVFGKYAKKSPTSILVTRVCLNEPSAENTVNHTLKVLKKQLLVDQIDIGEKIHSIQKDLFAQNEDIQGQFEEIKELLKKTKFRCETRKPENAAGAGSDQPRSREEQIEALWNGEPADEVIEGLPEEPKKQVNSEERLVSQDLSAFEREIQDLEKSQLNSEM